MRMLRTLAVIVAGSLALLLLGDAPVLANGSKGKRVRYGAEVQAGEARDKRCRFDAELEPLLFRLATVRGKYRVVRITIRNGGDKRLVLSLAGDRMDVELPGGARPAILDLGAHDPALWDSLSPSCAGRSPIRAASSPGRKRACSSSFPSRTRCRPRARCATRSPACRAGRSIMRDVTSVPLS